MSTHQAKSSGWIRALALDKVFNLILISIILVHFGLNFLGHPLIAKFYLVEVAVIIIGLLALPVERTFPALLYLVFIEGQGRILGSYSMPARLVFDGALLIVLIKGFASSRKIISLDKIPIPIIILLALHFLWFILQCFNITNVGLLGAVISSKMHIFPIFTFFHFLNNPVQLRGPQYNFLLFILSFITLMETILSIIQVGGHVEMMVSMHPYYLQPIGEAFAGSKFRPFGTTFAPGTISIYFYMSVALFFLKQPGRLIQRSLIYANIGFSWFALFMCQVRSAMAKEFAILLGIHLAWLSASQQKLKNIIIFFATVLLALPLSLLIPDLEVLFPKIDVDDAIQRVASLGEEGVLARNRIGFNQALDVLGEKLSDNPMGLGPGRQGAVQSFNKERIQDDPIYNLKYTWSYDNFFIFLAMELGYGMFFFLGVVVLVPVYLIFYALKALKRQHYDQFYTIAACAVFTLIELLGNYAAVGLIFMPSYFFFWLMAGIGFNAYHQSLLQMQEHLPDETTKEA